MAQYSIGEVEQLTGVKSHVLRYWEEVIPGFSPRKDQGGHRVYTQREIDIILRLKYLVYTQRFTIDGARKQVIIETEKAQDQFSTLQEIHQLRSDLSDLYFTIQQSRQKIQKSKSNNQDNSNEQ